MTRRSSQTAEDIAGRVAAVRERMARAAAAAGRRVEEITLVGVTKTRTAGEVRALIAAGVDAIGENRVQELLDKAPHLADLPHQTHLIGHLQRNKARFLPGSVDMLQSLDGVGTIEALERAYAGTGLRLPVLAEVNIGGESGKSGVSPAELPALLERVAASPVLQLKGLMAIPPMVAGEAIRRYFEQMRQLFIDIKDKKRDNESVSILSMGMSSDFEYAIAEGATMIRVGTDLFGPRQYSD